MSNITYPLSPLCLMRKHHAAYICHCRQVRLCRTPTLIGIFCSLICHRSHTGTYQVLSISTNRSMLATYAPVFVRWAARCYTVSELTTTAANLRRGRAVWQPCHASTQRRILVLPKSCRSQRAGAPQTSFLFSRCHSYRAEELGSNPISFRTSSHNTTLPQMGQNIFTDSYISQAPTQAPVLRPYGMNSYPFYTDTDHM